jgi:hypothetical protein
MAAGKNNFNSIHEVPISNFPIAGISPQFWFQEEIMKRKHASGRALPNDWTEVIAKVQEVLTQTESAAAEREQGLAGNTPAIPSTPKAAAWKHGFEQFEEHLGLFEAGVQQAEDDAADAELALADGEKALAHWLARATEITRRVAKPPVAATPPDGPTV